MYTKLAKLFAAEGPEKGLVAAQDSPALVLNAIRREVMEQVFSKRGTLLVPPLERIARYRELPPLGASTIGKWAEASRYRPAAEAQWVVIDWEQVARVGAPYLCETGRTPALALMCWGLLKEAVSRRSLPLAELLERELVQACARYYAIPYDTARYPLLTVHERTLRNALLDVFFKDKYFVQTIRRNFRDNFDYYSTDTGRLGSEVRNQLQALYPPDLDGFSISHYFTVISMARTRNIGRKSLPPLVIKGYDKNPYLNVPSKKNPKLYELGHIYHLGSPGVDGVWRYEDTTHPLRPVKYVVVHMGRYAEYRTQGGCDFYLKQLKKHKVAAASMLVSGVHFADWFRKKYPKLDIVSDYDHIHSLAEHREIFNLTSVNPSDLWVVPRSEIKKQLVQARDGALRLAKQCNDPNCARKTTNKEVASPINKTFWVESPPLADKDNTRLLAQGLSWYGRLYFSFRDFDLPIEQTQKMNRRGRYIAHKGVFTHPDLDTRFYTLDFLSNAKLGGIVPGTQAYEWLSTFRAMNKRQFREFKKDGRETVIKLERQARSQTYTHIPYSLSEAAHIIDRYRPGMTEQDIKKLMELLPGREWASIVRQAAKLCKEMIEAGVVDLKELPYRKFTPALSKLIRKRKIQISQDIPEMKEEKNNGSDINVKEGPGS